MARAKATAEKPAKKTKSTGPKKKMTEYNRFMKEELERLKEKETETGVERSHGERFKLAAQNWKTAPANKKRQNA